MEISAANSASQKSDPTSSQDNSVRDQAQARLQSGATQHHHGGLFSSFTDSVEGFVDHHVVDPIKDHVVDPITSHLASAFGSAENSLKTDIGNWQGFGPDPKGPFAGLEKAFDHQLGTWEGDGGENEGKMPGGVVALHERGHAHNDELHGNPLSGALDAGFTSIEADTHLINGQLLVGHNAGPTALQGRTLDKYYLQPLMDRVKKYGGVYKDGPPVTLLLDCKGSKDGNGNEIYQALQPYLNKYKDMLTHYDADGKKVQGPINIIISGAEPHGVLDKPGTRYVAFDGHVPDLLAHPDSISASDTPLVSGDFKQLFKWDGTGPISDQDKAKMKQIVDLAQQRGVRLRFWDAPDNPQAWSFLENAGVDYINTDKIQQFAKWQDKAGHEELPPLNQS